MSSFFVPNVGRDVLWERAVASLPPPLLEALRSAGLDDPGTLVEYPRSTVEELERVLGRTLGGCDALAPSGAASSEQTTSTYGHGVPLQALEWPGVAATGVFGSHSPGSDPKTDHASSMSLVCGDPRTDLCVQSKACVSADSPHPGGLATQTATPVSPACTDLGVSTASTHDPEVRDGCPSSAEISVHIDGLTTVLQDPDHRDEFPSSAELSDYRDGFPSAGVMEYSSTVFSRDFYADETPNESASRIPEFKSCPPVAAHPS